MGGGSTNMPGMSVHCNKCFQKASNGAKKCKCGASLRPRLDLKKVKKSLSKSAASAEEHAEHPQPSSEALGLPGVSNSCPKCRCEVKAKTSKCPKCGTAIKPASGSKDINARLETNGPTSQQSGENELLESGETGGEAAANEELAEGSSGESSKYAAAKVLSLIQKLPKGAQNPAAAATLLAGGYTGNEVRKFMAPPKYKQAAQKTAGVRYGNPVMSLRRPSWKAKKPSKALSRIKESSRKFTSSGLAKP
tara:strand:- start:2432 stop:3181 length:750 start_codon:yes stop_codon:yes gene_type:complete